MCTRATLRHVGSAAVLAACSAGTAQECDPFWSDAFDPRHVDLVGPMVAFDDGTGPALYAGIRHYDHPEWTQDINRLTGDRWTPIAPRLSGGAEDMVWVEAPPLGPALYVCGTFDLAGSVPGAARWDGIGWSALGDGVPGRPLAIAVFDGGAGPGLYISATDHSGPVSYILHWDGTSWSEVGGGVDGTVWDLAVFDDGTGPALYAGGAFDQMGGVPASNIARWDGMTWSPVGGGIGGGLAYRMVAVVSDGPGVASGLYVGGVFDTAGGVAVNGVARWDGKEWSPVGYGLDDGWVVLALVAYDDGSGAGPALYAASNFTEATGDPDAVGVGRWDGVAWSGVGGGVDVIVLHLATSDDGTGPGLYASGLIHSAGDVEAERIARWDGQSWAPVATGGINGPSDTRVLALLPEPEGGGVLAAGNFTSAGTTPAHSVARYGSDGWSALGDGVDGWVYELAYFDDGKGQSLIAGGSFDEAGGEAAANIARWDGASWSPLGAGIDELVVALEVFDDGSGGGPVLYAAGRFAHAGGAEAQNVARWDGVSWSAVGDGLVADYVLDLVAHDDGTGPALYAGGDFSPDGDDLPGVMRWDGEAWAPVGDGLLGAAGALAWFDDGTGEALYAAGALELFGDGASVARWDGKSWTDVSGTLHSGVTALMAFDDGTGEGPALYTGGALSVGVGWPYATLARWDGNAWSPLSLGSTDGESIVLAIAGMPDFDGQGPSIFAGGRFTSMYVQGAPGQGLEEIPSGRIARWLLCPPPASDLDGDGAIDVTDVELLLDAWGPCALPCPPTCTGDVDHDCMVGVLDLLMLLAEWAP